jgi:5'-3' exonuclease
MGDYLCLVGDASDNVIGAKGIGPKRAAELLATFGSIEDTYKALDAKTKRSCRRVSPIP